MELSWIGHSCFRLRGREATVITDPCARATGYSLAGGTADLVTLSNDHPNHCAIGEVAGNPTILDGPGEYEVKGVLVTGVRTARSKNEAAPLRNTAYIIQIDDVSVCHLGDLGAVPTGEQVELMKDVHVLLLPVGGHCTIGPAEAAEVVNQIEPRLVVPMHYGTEATTLELEGVERFLREMGLQHVEPQARLNVTHNSLPAEQAVVVLQFKQA